jgi:hypothetical protein
MKRSQSASRRTKMARPEDKDNADNQMGPRSIGSKGGTSGSTAGVDLTDEDESGLPEGTGSGGSTPDRADQQEQGHRSTDQ